MICEALSDRMPAVVRGETEWDVEEANHLAACGDCQQELALIATVLRSARTNPALDLERLAAAVVTATSVETPVISLASRRQRWRRGLVGLAAAAGVALAAYQLMPTTAIGEIASVPARVTTAIPEIDALLEEELRVVLASLTDNRTTLTPGPIPRLGELTEEELDALLLAVEG